MPATNPTSAALVEKLAVAPALALPRTAPAEADATELRVQLPFQVMLELVSWRSVTEVAAPVSHAEATWSSPLTRTRNCCLWPLATLTGACIAVAPRPLTAAQDAEPWRREPGSPSRAWHLARWRHRSP